VREYTTRRVQKPHPELQILFGWFLHYTVNAAVVALILAVSLALFRSAIVDGWTIIILVVGFVALLRFQVDSLWLVLGGAFLGLAHYLLV